ncbi:unnamed protein product [Oppiella nova]|uniref:Anti-proliferative protein domain-containing protein n=1 Tax=Oppiella nova TaxID=334625 RepID=A0A7R9M747_9ACAR|nr:unnamed protein product [Oppiella nova]CAG2171474.1 unnamed protein product [Oppiella nova]
MRVEIESAANFLSDLLRLHSHCPQPPLVEQFRLSIIDHLLANYTHHWFPDRPFKGSAYRCLRINHKMDPTLAKAGRLCGLTDAALRALLPNELTLWVDPNEVCYRIGENGSICHIFDSALPMTLPSPPSPPSSHLSSSQSSTASSSPSSSPSSWYQFGGGGGGDFQMRRSPLVAAEDPSATHSQKAFYLNSLLS